MNITYLKPHNGNRPGDTEEVPEGLGNYLIRCCVAEETAEAPARKQEKKPKQTKELKQEMETK